MATRVTNSARRERHEKRETTRKARENGLSRSSDFLASKLKCWQARHVKRDFRVCLNNRGFLLSSRATALVSRVSRPRRSRARALLSLNLKKRRDCSQSIRPLTLFHTVPFLTDKVPLLYTFYRQIVPFLHTYKVYNLASLLTAASAVFKYE